MLVRLMYTSRAAEGVDAEELGNILRQSKAHNPRHGITGVLCLCPTERIFIQLIEGGRGAVNRLYLRLASDPRHGELVLLHYSEIVERRFAGWSMGQANLARLNPALLLKYSETAALDPYALSGAVTMALFEELVATASIVGQS